MERTENSGFGNGFNLRFDQPSTSTDESRTVEHIAIEPDFSGPRSGDDDGYGNSFDPERHSGRRNRDGQWSLKRGRSGPRTAKEERTEKVSASDVNKWKGNLVLWHIGLAKVTKCPEFELDSDDADQLGFAVAQFMAAYKLKADPRIEAAVTLFIACGWVYGPKVAMIQMRRSEERKNKPDLHLVS